VLWAIAIYVIYGHSYWRLRNMAQPVLNVLLSGHCRYRITRLLYFAHEVTIAESLAEQVSADVPCMRASSHSAMLVASGANTAGNYGKPY
jgi:hypothetical protein